MTTTPFLAPLRRTLGSLSELKEFSTDPCRAMDRLHARHGPVSWLGAGPVRFALLLGQESTGFVLAHPELFSWQRAFGSLVPLAGPGALLVNDGERHRRLRRLVQPAFTARRAAGHTATVRRHVDRVVGAWRAGEVVEVHRQFRFALRDAMVEILFGPGALARADSLRGHLQTIHQAVDAGPLLRKVQGLGTPSWKRAVAAREAVRCWVAEEGERRRSGGAPAGADVMSTLLAGGAEGVPPLTDDEICDQLISFWEAAAETTSATFAWSLYSSLSDRAVWDAIAAEAGSGDDPVAAPNGLSYVDRVVQETLRLYPATVVVARAVATEFTFAGQRFPIGTKLLISPYHTHRLESLWEEPLRFDPGRWDTTRPDFRKPPPDAFLPFGGGPHRCVGAILATTVVRTALARVAGRAELRLLHGNAEPSGLIGMRPKHGLTVQVRAVASAREERR
ncbi:cytochrome P450 [Lentzea jiangxiensis]|uniref:Cytochrome P450 n=1 Tax=Lentzea jiangxiensis TaxID=641025 RepID=A0A1H0VNU0_9PSEU|nr:cytochrome P450 [Lentzea jiangxiensis]SDP80177.1 hypothetical protein SAMN05421507_11535 [Lentzea jiangxiensis]